MVKSVVEIVLLIKERPAMYISRNYISCLAAFLTGWTISNSENVDDIHILHEFQDYVSKKYNVTTSHSWASILLFYSADECDALNLFFKEFDIFLSQKSK